MINTKLHNRTISPVYLNYLFCLSLFELEFDKHDTIRALARANDIECILLQHSIFILGLLEIDRKM